MLPSNETILTLLVTGKSAEYEKIDDHAVTQTINTLAIAARKTPNKLLKAITNAVEVRIDGMIMIALAIFIGQAEEKILQQKDIKSTLFTLLDVYNPPKLLEFVELLKSKVFGRGFGSRSQKWVRSVMESWSIGNLRKFSIECPKELYSLIILVHPRYYGHRGSFIKQFLAS